MNNSEYRWSLKFGLSRAFAGLLATVLINSFGSPLWAANSTDWKSNDEAQTRLLTPYGLESDGKTLWIGLEFELEKGWHSYWKNPGDAGLPPAFTIPDSSVIRQLEIQFPTPKFYPFGGGLDAYGYGEHVIYPVKLTLSEATSAKSKFDLNLDLTYLVCKDLCIPHDESFTIEVDLTRPGYDKNPDGYVAKTLSESIRKLPHSPAEVAGFSTESNFYRDGKDYLLEIRSQLPQAQSEFPDIYFHSAPDFKLGAVKFDVGLAPTELVVTVPVQTKVAGVKVDSAQFGYLLSGIVTGADTIAVETSAMIYTEDNPDGSASAMTGPAGFEDYSLGLILLLAILGGLVLNVMPCVLPVLSIKLMSILEHSGESRGRIVRGMLASTGGIVTSFLLLAFAAVLAKNAGAIVGWGVQFQEPTFVTFLAVVVFLFGLNLWGVFEVSLPSTVATGATNVASSGGHFMQGMLATLLATPCSAPFLGTAISFALSSSATTIFAVFAAVGIGMSLPYLVLTAFPGAIRFLPKPGPWMHTTKVFFGFLLMATVIWLIYILAAQVNAFALAMTLLLLLTIGFIVWLKGALAPFARFFSSASGLITIIAVVGVSYYAITNAGAEESLRHNDATLIVDEQGIQWEAFTDAKLDERLAQGEIVFVDVTAEWCMTCKANERLFIETDPIRDRIRDHNITALKADWTNRNEAISDFLKDYGRTGIPFYVIFYGKSRNNYLTLPVTITTGLLADRLDEAISKNAEFARDASQTDNLKPAGFKLETN